jgi:hypothetical protein
VLSPGQRRLIGEKVVSEISLILVFRDDWRLAVVTPPKANTFRSMAG